MIREERRKVYVEVTALHTPEGATCPLSLIFEDTTYEIDQVKRVCRAAASKVGGTGIRYTIVIMGRESFLFEDEGKWFVEAKN